MEKELVSIVVPVYNAEQYLQESVKSLFDQTYSNIEIILIDDGSSDDSLKKCDELALCDPRCRVIHKENAGVSHTRNLGIKEAKGEYIMFFDSDDFLEKNAVEICVTQMKKDGTDAVFFGMFFDTYRDGVCIKQEKRCVSHDEIIYKTDILDRIILLERNNYMSPVWNKLIKKSVLEKNSIRFNVNLTNYEDYLFSLQLLNVFDSISVISNSLYHYVRKERVGLSRRYVDGYECKMEILISEADVAFNKLGFSSREAAEYKKAIYIYWTTLALMNFSKKQASFKIRVKDIYNYIKLPVVKKRLNAEYTTNKFAKILCFFVKHNMAKTICLLCTLKIKYKGKHY